MPQAAPVRASALLDVATSVGGVWGMPTTLRPALAGGVGRRLDVWLTAADDPALTREDEIRLAIGPLGDGAGQGGAVRSDRGSPSVTSDGRGFADHARWRRADPRGAGRDELDGDLDRAPRTARFPRSPRRADGRCAGHDGVAGVASPLSGRGAGVRHARHGRGVALGARLGAGVAGSVVLDPD